MFFPDLNWFPNMKSGLLPRQVNIKCIYNVRTLFEIIRANDKTLWSNVFIQSNIVLEVTVLNLCNFPIPIAKAYADVYTIISGIQLCDSLTLT